VEPSKAVLVVEDNDVNRMLILRQLERLGYAATAVGNGFEAVEAVRRARYGLILMDLFMPGMDGFEAARRIREMESIGPRHTPIIAVTADATESARVASSVAGIDDYISKPVLLETLKGTLARWIAPTSGAVAGSSAPAPAGDEHDAQAVDLEALERLREQLGDNRSVRKLVARYLAELPARVRSIRTAAAGGDAEGLKLAAHTLRSTSILLGAETLAALCLELEAWARLGKTKGIEKKIAPLETESRAVEAALRARL
jgi:CheY-like chemotaxis protein